MNKPRFGWIMKVKNPLKKPQERQERSQEPIEVRYYHGKHEVEFPRKTPQGCLCKALTPFTSGDLTVEINMEFLAEPRFLWRTKRKQGIT